MSREVIEFVNSYELVLQEITSQEGVNGDLSNRLNIVSSGYSAGTFIQIQNEFN